MRAYKGILFILFIMCGSALLWYFAKPMAPIHPLNTLSHVIGGLAITCLFLVFY